MNLALVKKLHFPRVIVKKVLSATVVTALALVIVTLAAKKIDSIAKKIQQQRVASEVLSKRNETFSKLRDEFRIVADNDQKVLDAFPSVDNVLNFIASLESIASTNSLAQSVKFSTPLPQATDGGLALMSIDYDVTLNGNVVTLLTYLKSFEQLPYFSSMSSLSITSSNSLGWEGDSVITYHAKLYAR